MMAFNIVFWTLVALPIIAAILWGRRKAVRRVCAAYCVVQALFAWLNIGLAGRGAEVENKGLDPSLRLGFHQGAGATVHWISSNVAPMFLGPLVALVLLVVLAPGENRDDQGPR